MNSQRQAQQGNSRPAPNQQRPSARRRRNRGAGQRRAAANPKAPRQQQGDRSEKRKTARLSACAKNYVSTLANPFTGPLSCVPEYPSVASTKKRFWAKTSFANSSTNGFGFVVACPERGVTNDAIVIEASSANSTGTTVQISDANNITALSNSEYPQAIFGSANSDAQYRVVGAGLRVKYTGTVFNQGGSMVVLQDPTHDSLGGRSLASFDAEKQAVKFKISEDWTTVVYRPVLANELNYKTGVNNVFYMGFAIQTPPGVSVSFDVEFYGVYEINGTTIRGQTPTHADPVGAAAASFVSQVSTHLTPNRQSDTSRMTGAVNDMAKYVLHGMTHQVLSNSPLPRSAPVASASSSSSSSGFFGSLANVAMEVLPEIMAFL